MSWIPVLLLTAAAFAVAAFAFRLERRLWTTLLAALVFGLAGYAFQARPDLGASVPDQGAGGAQDQWASVEARQEMVSSELRSRSDKLLIADALARRGQFGNAAALLRSATEDDPQDAEAWLALGNVLVEHAGGVLTPASLFAYRQAGEAAPGSPVPGYFVGLALIRQGSLLEGRQVWAQSLAEAAGDDPARALLSERVSRLDTLLAQAGVAAPTSQPESAPTAAP